MLLKVIGTGSKGNCYVIKSEKTGRFIILDCGIKFEKIITDSNFNGFEKLDFVFCSHIHKDHSLSLDLFKLNGCNIIDWNSKTEIKKTYGEWEFATFEVKHNVKCLGIIIRNTKSNETIAYMTDFCECPRLIGINHFIYEVNYDEETINKKIMLDNADFQHIRASLNNHNSLENAVSYFNLLSYKPKSLNICHMSKDHCSKNKVLNCLTEYVENVNILENNMEYKI